MLISDFATAIHEGIPETETKENPERKLLYWRQGKHLPENDRVIKNIFKIFFGDDPSLEDWRIDLERSLGSKTLDKPQIPKGAIKGGTPSKRYLDFISKFDPAKPTIPVIYTCYGNSVNAILDDRSIIPAKNDNILKRNASFFFYGLPKYRSPSEETYGHSNQSALFSFIFDYSRLSNASGILPFDSSKYNSRRDIVGNADLVDFYIPNSVESPGKFVSAFFGSNRRYFESKIRDGILSEISPFDFHSRSFIDICESEFSENQEYLEIHYTDPITVSKSNLLAIIAPAWACEDDVFISFANEMDASLLYYDFEFQSKIRPIERVKDSAKAWLDREGITHG